MPAEGNTDEKEIIHLISEFVIELLEMLGLEQDKINSELVAKLELVSTLRRPEDMMVHLCSIG